MNVRSLFSRTALMAVQIVGVSTTFAADKLYPIAEGGKWGYIDSKGKVVVQPQFDEATNFSEDKASVSKGDTSFIINKKGQIIVDESLEWQPSAPGVPDDSEPPSGSGNR